MCTWIHLIHSLYFCKIQLNVILPLLLSSQAAYSLHVVRSKFCVNLLSFARVLHVSPILSFFAWSPQSYRAKVQIIKVTHNVCLSVSPFAIRTSALSATQTNDSNTFRRSHCLLIFWRKLGNKVQRDFPIIFTLSTKWEWFKRRTAALLMNKLRFDLLRRRYLQQLASKRTAYGREVYLTVLSALRPSHL